MQKKTLPTGKGMYIQQADAMIAGRRNGPDHSVLDTQKNRTNYWYDGINVRKMEQVLSHPDLEHPY